MAGAYVRELLREEVEEKLPVLYGADIDVGIKSLLTTEQIQQIHVALAYLFSEGYSISELEAFIPNAQELLISFFSLLSATIQYDDEVIVQLWLSRTQKRAVDMQQRWEMRQLIQAYRDKIEEYSRNFEQKELT